MTDALVGAITEATVRAFVGEGSFARAGDYVLDGAVFDARRQGRTLRASCEGQTADSYAVHAALGDRVITAAGCTCPVGGDGRCKHVAALLLTWLERPGDFVVVDDVDRCLRGRTRAELTALIKQMIRQQPDLETLLVTPLPDGRASTPRSLAQGAAPRLYRRQADAVFRRNGTEWGALSAIVPELRAIAAIGDGFVAQGDAASAIGPYEGILEAVLARYAEFERQDGDGLLRHVITDCVEGLGRCMERSPAPVRERVLRVLFDALDDDDHLGDAGPLDEVPEVIDARAQGGERALVASWIRALDPNETRWQAIAHAGLLFDLEADTLPDDAYLTACAALGRHRARVERLLARGRIDDALAAAEESSTASMREVAELLAAGGHGDAAEDIVRRRTKSIDDVGLLEWLLARARQRGDEGAVIRGSEALLVAAPTIDRWRVLRRAVANGEAWATLRGALVDRVARRAPRVAVEALLDEGDIAAAFARVADLGTVDANGAPVAGGLRLRVAEAAERTHPREALAIWGRHADDLVATGRRTQYREAALAARRVCALFDAAGDHAAGVAWLTEFKARHARLRALRDELHAAGL